jgi:hypothetical protein
MSQNAGSIFERITKTVVIPNRQPEPQKLKDQFPVHVSNLSFKFRELLAQLINHLNNLQEGPKVVFVSHEIGIPFALKNETTCGNLI